MDFVAIHLKAHKAIDHFLLYEPLIFLAICTCMLNCSLISISFFHAKMVFIDLNELIRHEASLGSEYDTSATGKDSIIQCA